MKRLNRTQISRAYARENSEHAFVSSRDKKRMRAKKSGKETEVLSSEPPAPKKESLFKIDNHAPLPQTLKAENGSPITLWSRKIDANAWRQAQDLSKLPFMHPKGLALMPDVHVGNGACVGSVLPFRQALVPSSIGVDCGCGMQAVRLSLTADMLPDNLKSLRFAMEKSCVSEAHKEIINPDAWRKLHERYTSIVSRHRKVYKGKAGEQLGTLGGGNHFNEICLDKTGQVWVMLHSGSRGVGNNLGKYFIEMALRRTERENGILPNRALGWLPEGCPEFNDYLEAMMWAQDYAAENRNILMTSTLQCLRDVLGLRFKVLDEAVSCHHNYVAKEHHFGEDLWITRKGAVRAGLGELAIIPGSMGKESFIVRGRGDPNSYCSCAHGAGRLMSRGEARLQFSSADLRRQTEGVECKKDKSIIDEIPSAYKSITEVMKNQSDLVEVVHTLKAIVCVKGG